MALSKRFLLEETFPKHFILLDLSSKFAFDLRQVLIPIEDVPKLETSDLSILSLSE
jgi:hypothetical protein